MAAKEATARIKINRLLEAAGWRFFPEDGQPANIRLEPSVTIKASDLDALGNQMADRLFPGKYQSDFAVQVTSQIPDAQQFSISFTNNSLLGSGNFLRCAANLNRVAAKGRGCSKRRAHSKIRFSLWTRYS